MLRAPVVRHRVGQRVVGGRGDGYMPCGAEVAGGSLAELAVCLLTSTGQRHGRGRAQPRPEDAVPEYGRVLRGERLLPRRRRGRHVSNAACVDSAAEMLASRAASAPRSPADSAAASVAADCSAARSSVADRAATVPDGPLLAAAV